MNVRSMLVATVLVGSTLFLTGGPVGYFEESLPTTMNPLFARSMVDRRSHELVFDRLFFRSAVTNELKSRLVDFATPAENGKKLILKLKRNVKWHDGSNFVASDVCFTVDAMLNPKTPSTIAKEYRDTIVGCEFDPDDSYTATIEFVKPFHNPQERVAFSVIPAAKFNGNTAIVPDADFSSRPVGTGPMKGAAGREEVSFSSYSNGHHNARIPKLSQRVGGDPLIQVKTLLNAGVQGIISVSPGRRPEVASSDDVALKDYDLRSWWFIALNTNDRLSNKYVRTALNYAIDRNALREFTIGATKDDKNSPCEFISGPFVGVSPYYNRSIQVNESADQAKVKELMTKAGATMQAKRWILNGEPIELRIGMNSPLDGEAKDLLAQIGNQLHEAGFGRSVYKVPADDWQRKAVTGQLGDTYDMLIGKWSFGVVEDVGAQFHSRGDGRGAKNIFNYSNPEVDAILARYEAARTDTAAQDAYHDLHAFVAEDLPYLFLWKLDTKSAWRNEIRNTIISPYYYFTEFDQWRK